jgi:hypothetical protein
MRCRSCDAPNPPDRSHCAACGAKLPAPPGRASVPRQTTPAKPRRRAEASDADAEVERPVSRMIPYRNVNALIAYYCGMFALIPAAVYPLILIGAVSPPDNLRFLSTLLPAVGILLGGAALALGVFGLRHARARPKTGGGGHALTGVFLGALALFESAIGLALTAAGVLPVDLFR